MYSVEMAFQALRFLIASASGSGYVTRHHWHSTCAVGLMGGAGAVNGGCELVNSMDDLRSRFHSALLSKTYPGSEVDRWRRDKGIDVNAVIRMPFRHYKPFHPPSHLPWRCEDDVRKDLTELLVNSVGIKLAASLNSVHRSANVVHSVGIRVGPESFNFELAYGFKDPRIDNFDSRWYETLASTEGDEPFLDTLARAIHRLHRFKTDPSLSAMEFGEQMAA